MKITSIALACVLASTSLDMPMGDSLFEGMRKAGLSLTAGKAPIEVLVIDEIQKVPTNN
jgi:uncharacterized protein (TIGR03435 family)